MEEQYQETVDADADAGVSNREDTQVSGGGQQRTWDESEIRAVVASPSALVAILRDAVAKRCAFNSTGADKKLNSSMEGRDATTLSVGASRELLLDWLLDTGATATATAEREKQDRLGASEEQQQRAVTALEEREEQDRLGASEEQQQQQQRAMNVLDSLHEMMGGLNDRMRAMEDFAATQKRTTLTTSKTQHETPLTPTTKNDASAHDSPSSVLGVSQPLQGGARVRAADALVQAVPPGYLSTRQADISACPVETSEHLTWLSTATPAGMRPSDSRLIDTVRFLVSTRASEDLCAADGYERDVLNDLFRLLGDAGSDSRQKLDLLRPSVHFEAAERLLQSKTYEFLLQLSMGPVRLSPSAMTVTNTGLDDYNTNGNRNGALVALDTLFVHADIAAQKTPDSKEELLRARERERDPHVKISTGNTLTQQLLLTNARAQELAAKAAAFNRRVAPGLRVPTEPVTADGMIYVKLIQQAQGDDAFGRCAVAKARALYQLKIVDLSGGTDNMTPDVIEEQCASIMKSADKHGREHCKEEGSGAHGGGAAGAGAGAARKQKDASPALARSEHTAKKGAPAQVPRTEVRVNAVRGTPALCINCQGTGHFFSDCVEPKRCRWCKELVIKGVHEPSTCPENKNPNPGSPGNGVAPGGSSTPLA